MSETTTYDKLFAGSEKRPVHKTGTVKSGESLLKGSVVGEIKKAVGSITADPGNTGEGEIASFELGDGAKIGDYAVECIKTTKAISVNSNPRSATIEELAIGDQEVAQLGDYKIVCTDAGTPEIFSVFTPNGERLEDLEEAASYANDHIEVKVTENGGDVFQVGDEITFTVAEAVETERKFKVENPDGTQIGVATQDVEFSSELVFTVASSGADFVAGDKFTLTVDDGSDELLLADKDAKDGSDAMVGILAEDVDASAGALPAVYWTEGIFDEDQLTYAAGENADTYRDEAQELGIYLVTTD
jgi:hypothetical protein